MAAFFALQIVQFPKDDKGALAMELDYVARYLCKTSKSTRRTSKLNNLLNFAISRNFRGHHCAIHCNRIQRQSIKLHYSRMVRPPRSHALRHLAFFEDF